MELNEIVTIEVSEQSFREAVFKAKKSLPSLTSDMLEFPSRNCSRQVLLVIYEKEMELRVVWSEQALRYYIDSHSYFKRKDAEKAMELLLMTAEMFTDRPRYDEVLWYMDERLWSYSTGGIKLYAWILKTRCLISIMCDNIRQVTKNICKESLTLFLGKANKSP